MARIYTCMYMKVYVEKEHCIVPDVEVLEDLGIKVINFSCHIQYVANTIWNKYIIHIHIVSCA